MASNTQQCPGLRPSAASCRALSAMARLVYRWETCGFPAIEGLQFHHPTPSAMLFQGHQEVQALLSPGQNHSEDIKYFPASPSGYEPIQKFLAWGFKAGMYKNPAALLKGFTETYRLRACQQLSATDTHLHQSCLQEQRETARRMCFFTKPIP